MISEKFEIKIYQDKNGKQPFIEWLETLADKRARAKIKVRLARIRLGHLGDWKSLGDGIYELRIDEGAGYRLYFTQEPNRKIILCNGSKNTQHKDIGKAKIYLNDYRR
jgi:putative addiction module killer protein